MWSKPCARRRHSRLHERSEKPKHEKEHSEKTDKLWKDPHNRYSSQVWTLEKRSYWWWHRYISFSFIQESPLPTVSRSLFGASWKLRDYTEPRHVLGDTVTHDSLSLTHNRTHSWACYATYNEETLNDVVKWSPPVKGSWFVNTTTTQRLNESEINTNGDRKYWRFSRVELLSTNKDRGRWTTK